MMKRFLISKALIFVLCCFAFCLSGCGCFPPLRMGCDQPGETKAEGQRRHIRNARINNQELAEDVDAFWLTDQPSTLSEKRIP